MYKLDRFLVALDLTALDEAIISYASTVAELLGTSHVYFFHVAKSLDIPDEISKKYPDLMAPLDESLKNDLQKKISAHFLYDCDYSIVVREGNPTDKILRWSDIKEVDLIIVGRKIQLKGSGVLPHKLSRLAHCSMLYIPENTRSTIEKILVPVDFSKNSSLALETAMILKKDSALKIYLQNAYQVPWGYHSTGKSYEEFSEIMKDNAQKSAKKFLKLNKIQNGDVELVLSLDEEKDPAEVAYAEATRRKVDMIIMSSKGRSGLANFIMGSVASKMAYLDSSIPLFIAKNKADNMGFFEALLRV